MNFQHRAAIHLNNTAVTLLHRGCYEQGLQTISDAVTIMKSAMPEEGSVGDSEHVNALVHRAAQRLAASKSLHTIEAPEIISDSSSLRIFRKALNSRQLIRIEDNEYNCTHIVFDVLSAVMLFNFGLAYRLVVKMTEDSSTKQEFNTCAMRLFHLSYDILSASLECQIDWDETDIRRIILTATLVLLNMIELSDILHLEDHEEHYSDLLNGFLASVRELQDNDWASEELAAAAA